MQYRIFFFTILLVTLIADQPMHLHVFTRVLKCLQPLPSDVFHPHCYLPQSFPAVCDGWMLRKRRMSQNRCPHCFPITCFSPFSPSSYCSFQHITSATWPTAAGKLCHDVRKNKSRLSEAQRGLHVTCSRDDFINGGRKGSSLSWPG